MGDALRCGCGGRFGHERRDDKPISVTFPARNLAPAPLTCLCLPCNPAPAPLACLCLAGPQSCPNPTRLPLPGHALALQELGLCLCLRRLDHGHLKQ